MHVQHAQPLLVLVVALVAGVTLWPATLETTVVFCYDFAKLVSDIAAYAEGRLFVLPTSPIWGVAQ